MKHKSITVELAGGLGNQLFGYFAGLYLSKETNRILILDMQSVDLVRTNGLYCLDSFSLGEEFKHRDQKHATSLSFLRLRDGIYRRAKTIRELSDCLFNVVRDQGKHSNVRNCKRYLVKVRKNINLIGYFQDFSYYREYVDDPIVLNLKNPSSWFTTLAEEIENNNIITLHVRLGDFRENMDTIGILGARYYKEAIELLGPTSNSEIWVFSDSPRDAQQMLSSIGSLQLRHIYAPADSDPAESLILISKGRQIITSNSTFSLWAAMFSNRNSKVVYPRKMYKSNDDGVKNIPAHWIPQPSHWL